MFKNIFHTNKFARKPDGFRTPKTNGFTLVELLLVVTLISILSGVLISSINYVKHRNNADDAIRKETLYKIVESLEAYSTSERGMYPSDTDGNGNPSDDAMLATYFKKLGLSGAGTTWPNDNPKGATYTYWVSSGRTSAGVIVNENSGKFLKYTTTSGVIRECTAPVSASDEACN